MEQKLGISEFFEVFYDNISVLITNGDHIEQNQDFYDRLVLKCFRLYEKKSSNYTVSEVLDLFLNYVFENQSLLIDSADRKKVSENLQVK